MGKKLTHDEFINKAKDIHKNNFDYSLVEYKNQRTKIQIKCNICNTIFEQMPSNHISGQGCTLTNEIFIQKSKEIHKNDYDYSLTLYTKMSNKVKVPRPKTSFGLGKILR
jgi:hypothetical protein